MRHHLHLLQPPVLRQEEFSEADRFSTAARRQDLHVQEWAAPPSQDADRCIRRVRLREGPERRVSGPAWALALDSVSGPDSALEWVGPV